MPWWNPFRKTGAKDAREPANTSQAIHERLLRDRIVMIGVPIDDEVASLAVAQLLFLESESPTQEIRLFINSPGGSVTATFAICDTVEYVKSPVATICVGECSGSAALLMALGAKGQRFAMRESQFMLTPLTGGAGTTPESRPIIERMRHDLITRLARATGQPAEQVRRDCEAKRTLSAEEAVRYGLVDQLMDRRPA
ncbi:ATP-dependent Clp protease proteolytic subunit [Corallococcus sp. AB049A]|uniref:ATP-dependent Clp protease proteolytic subunit n=1 Tax=Corallococcus interemptor TaxID=2316720 RepID=A0A3A8QQI0_9BACT|nr:MULTISPECIES: ATP-dependent Clp protease proteolytic subunit [Corallococcus]RKH71029.1 ATP-dependent Clp protease proteolytic subunit [Corallococcus interemptor]RKI71578.1 ATP-dependent Clp protease proteolytic subunit [Corallococcus sp. AB049A]